MNISLTRARNYASAPIIISTAGERYSTSRALSLIHKCTDVAGS